MLVSPLCVNIYAQQQIPNSDFEGGWTDCVPWTFYVSQGEEGRYGEISEVVAGKNPNGWVISNVAGMASYYDGLASGLGATVVGDSVEGFNSNSAVKLTNTPNHIYGRVTGLRKMYRPWFIWQESLYALI